jgi:hypothetical protein
MITEGQSKVLWHSGKGNCYLRAFTVVDFLWVNVPFEDLENWSNGSFRVQRHPTAKVPFLQGRRKWRISESAKMRLDTAWKVGIKVAMSSMGY